MLKINGSSGGGQILRSALALSVITGKSFEIKNIRGSREKPGLKQQHLEGARAISKICNAEIKGDSIGSKDLLFRPGKISGKDYEIDIKTAGSITLALQTLIPALIFADKKTNLKINGGTDVKWSPSFDYYYNIPMRFLEMLGVDAHLELIKRGFYPKGGGVIRLEIHPCKKLERLEMIERGSFERVDLFNYTSQDLKKTDVLNRQKKAFEKEIGMKVAYHMNDYVDSLSTGSVMHAHAHYSNTILGTDELGDKGKRAEEVGRELAKKLRFEMNSNAVVDGFMADQLLIFMALAKGGRFVTSKISNHVLNNIKVIEKFLNVNFNVKGNLVECKT